MERSLEKATQLELMAAYAQKCKKLDAKDSSITFKILDDENFQIEYEGYGPEKYNMNMLHINDKRTLKEASRLELIAKLARNIVAKKVGVKETAFEFIKVNDNEFQIQELGNIPTNYVINDFIKEKEIKNDYKQ